ncbi:MAG: hypothetical protein FJ038_04260 [Chloroflexi bacterium]|nr:hypothetical protein [Chloroflexota bacterium]
MPGTVTPLSEMQRRAVDAGRLRYGVKTERAMKALEFWRITSRDESSIRALAKLYGGTAQPWNPGRGRSEWEVLTEARTINVIVPPPHVALGGTPIYEMWTAAGKQRECDGRVVEIPSDTPHGTVKVEQPCICDHQGKMVCKPITRLSVMLPDIPFTGLWMMESKGWNAAKELPGMVDLVFELQEHGFARARLTLEKRTKTENGKTSHYVVPVLSTPATPNQVALGAARMVSIAANTETRSIAAPSEPSTPIDPDSEVAEAEVVDEDQVVLLRRTIHQHVANLGVTTDQFRGLCFAVSDGQHYTPNNLPESDLQRLVGALEKVAEGTHRLELRGSSTVLMRTAPA